MTDTTDAVDSDTSQRRPTRSVRRAATLGVSAAVGALALLGAGTWAGWALRDVVATPSYRFTPSAAPGTGAKAVEVRWGGGSTARLPLCGTGVEPSAATSVLRTLGARDGYVIYGASTCIRLDQGGVDVVLRAAHLDPAGCLLGERDGGDLVVSGAPREVCRGFLDSPAPEPVAPRGSVGALAGVER